MSDSVNATNQRQQLVSITRVESIGELDMEGGRQGGREECGWIFMFPHLIDVRIELECSCSRGTDDSILLHRQGVMTRSFSMTP